MRRLGLLALGLVLAAPASASAWCRMTSSLRSPTLAEPCVLPDPTTEPPEQFLAWQRPCSSISLSVSATSRDLTPDEIYGVLDRSIATWEAVTCGGVAIGVDVAVMEAETTCTAPLYRDDGGNVNSIMFIADWAEREYDAGAFALTTVWHRRSTGEILDADMEINELRGPYAICPPEGCTTMRGVDLENVVTHELGHYLGLAHSTNMDATMFASSVAGETIKRDLDADDVAGLCEIYPAGTPAAECDFSPRGGLDLDCDEGCSVSAPGASGSSGLGWALALLGLALWRRRR